MPTAHLFARRMARRISLLAAVVALAVGFVSLTSTRTTIACGPPPVPLRALYMHSDLVVVARFGETIPVEIRDSEDENYKSYLMRSELKVASTVKGLGDQAVVHVYHTGWSHEGAIQHSLVEEARSGKVLTFLVKRENEDGYELASDSYGAKSLSDAALKVYLQRLDELALILQQEKPDPARIVEWLVRCAEEPATRFEGLHELSMSRYALLNRDASEENADEPPPAEANETAKGESAEASHASPDASGPNGEKRVDSGETSAEVTSEQIVSLPVLRRNLYLDADPDFVGLLTAEQKSRLANTLFSAKPLTYSEMPLIELLQVWKDPALVPFMMKQLRSFADDPPYEAESLVGFIAEALKDKELARLAEQYSEKASYDDQVEDVSNDSEPESEAEGEAAEQAEAQEEPEDEEPAPEEQEDTIVGDDKQKRSIRLRRFLARAETILAQQR